MLGWMELTRRKFEDFSNIKVSFFTGLLNSRVSPTHDDVLVIAFESRENVDRKDVRFMNAMKIAAANVWRPTAIVLDLVNLRYVWGDDLQLLFQNPYPPPATLLQQIFEGDPKEQFPIVAVASSHNREGLTSLVRKEIGLDPAKVLFESLDEAVSAIEAVLK